MNDHIESALRIARRYGQRYAEGGMTLKRTEPFPEAPEGYEYYAPADDPGPGDIPPAQQQQQTPEPANEYELQRQQAEALPERPPVAMEPDLNAAQMREQDVPEGYAVNDAGVLFNKETGEELHQTRRSSVLPFTRTPEGQYQWNMPRVADIFGNMGGGWSAPVTGAETILGAGARLPRRRAAPPQGPLNLDTFFRHASPSEVEHLTASDLSALNTQLHEAGEGWVRYSNEHPELWDALMARLDKKPKPEMPQHNFKSLDELEQAYNRVTSAEHPNAPIANGERLSIHDFFGNHNEGDVARLTDAQLRSLWDEILHNQANDTGTWSNISTYQPELVEAIRKRANQIAEPPKSIEDQLNHLLRESGISENAPVRSDRPAFALPQPVPSGPFDRLSSDFQNFYNRTIAPRGPSNIHDFAEMYFGGQDTKRITGRVAEDGHRMSRTPGVQFVGTLRTPDGQTIGHIEREIFPEAKFAYHGFFSVSPELRSTGIAPAVLRNQIELYKKLGLNGVDLFASLDSGPYAWLKYGWLPNQYSWNNIRSDIARNINNDVLHIKDPESKAAVLRLLQDPDPRAAWALSDVKLPDAYGDPIGIVAFLGYKGVRTSGPNKGTHFETNHGKQDWAGTLNLNDRASMERFNRYATRQAKKKPRE